MDKSIKTQKNGSREYQKTQPLPQSKTMPSAKSLSNQKIKILIVEDMT